MPMIIEKYLQSLRTEIRSADVGNASLLLNNVKVYAKNIRTYATIPAEAERALTLTVEKAAALAAAYRSFGMMGSAGRSAIEAIREQALEAAAPLDALLENAELNERGRALFG